MIHSASLAHDRMMTRPAGTVVVVLADPVDVELPFTSPLAADDLMAFLSRRAVPGVEHVRGREYARTLRIGSGSDAAIGTISLRLPGPADKPMVQARLRFADGMVEPAIRRCRHLLDLDTDAADVDRVLRTDAGLAGSVQAHPGLRVPGTADAAETLVKAMLGQQVSVAGARTAATRLVAMADDRLPEPVDGLTHLFPTPARIAELGPVAFAGPRNRAQAIVTAASVLADRTLRLSPDDPSVRSRLLALPGIGPWTANYLAMRVLDDHDVLLVEDLAVRRGAAALGLPDEPKDLAERGLAWRPYRSYAGMHLWVASA
jgi:AraC family transcriptional regulator of adaptative response / DNA-3-methyladenine glycosylase II